MIYISPLGRYVTQALPADFIHGQSTGRWEQPVARGIRKPVSGWLRLALPLYIIIGSSCLSLLLVDHPSSPTPLGMRFR